MRNLFRFFTVLVAMSLALGGCRNANVAESRLAAVRHGVLCLTFDDRNWDRWVKAIPLFERHGAHASFFPNGQLDPHALECLKLLHEKGHTVGLHMQHHRDAPQYVEKHGFDAYWNEEIAPQLAAYATVGIAPTALAYPNNRRTDEIDAQLAARGFRRLRAGVPGARPHDPKHLQKATLVPFPELDAMYVPVDSLQGRVLMQGVGVGENYNTDIDDLLAGLRRAAARNEAVTIFSHDISPNAHGISMKTEWLERILAVAQAEGMAILGFDDLDAR